MTERLNSNRYIAYPFQENAARTATAGAVVVTLTNDVVVDAYVCGYNYAISGCALTGIVVAADGLSATLTFTCTHSGGSFTISILVSASYSEYLSVSTFSANTYQLNVTVGPGFKLFAATYPATTFIVSDCALEPSCLHVRDRHVVRSVQGINGKFGSIALTADAKILAGFNALVRVQSNPPRVTIGAAVGAGLGTPCMQMLDEPSDCDKYVYSINGVGPDDMGRLNLQGLDGVKVIPVPEENTVELCAPYKDCPAGCRS